MLKKGGIIFVFILLSFTGWTQAQTVCKDDKNKEVKKMHPIEFIHQYLLNPDVQNAKVYTPQEEGSFGSVMNWLQEKYSSLLDVIPSSIKNNSLYAFIDDWYGVRYRMGGTTKRGIDCSAFVQKLYNDVFGLNIVRTAASQHNECHMVNKNELREGDLVFFRIGTSRISHVGVYLQNDKFVHSSSSRGVMISNLNSSYWSRYYAGGGRLL